MITPGRKWPIWSVAMRRFLLSVLMCAAASGAQAADLPDFPVLRGGFTDGFTTPPVNWRGFYIGGAGPPPSPPPNNGRPAQPTPSPPLDATTPNSRSTAL